MPNHIKNIVICFYVLCLSVCSGAAFAATSGIKVECPREVAVGEPFVLTISAPAKVDDVNVVWLGKTISLKGQGKRAELMLPTPLETNEKSLSLLLLSAKGNMRIFSSSITVRQKDFPVQKLNVDPRFVTPPASEVPRIEREAKKLRAIYAGFTPERHWRLPLHRPLSGAITSEFGVKRVFNGEPRSRHKGVDLRGAEGTEIGALAAGKVVLAENTYYAGNLVVIDHGLGVFTSYSHLSKFKVKEGDFVKSGALVGLVGATGRVTGPHLHLGLIVQGESQSPEPLMPDFRKK